MLPFIIHSNHINNLFYSKLIQSEQSQHQVLFMTLFFFMSQQNLGSHFYDKLFSTLNCKFIIQNHLATEVTFLEQFERHC